MGSWRSSELIQEIAAIGAQSIHSITGPALGTTQLIQEIAAIGAESLSHMRPSAIFVDTARQWRLPAGLSNETRRYLIAVLLYVIIVVVQHVASYLSVEHPRLDLEKLVQHHLIAAGLAMTYNYGRRRL